jgi:RecJ-like exonuclease
VDGVRAGILEVRRDISFYGRVTRPLHRLLEYASDPSLPGLSGSASACQEFLKSLGIPQNNGNGLRTWIQLDDREKETIISALVVRVLEGGYTHKEAMSLIEDMYLLCREDPRSELYDAKEYATLLNSCGRYDRADLGYQICRGDRGEGLARARNLQQGHRSRLVQAMNLVKEMGIKEMGEIQYFNAGDAIEDTIVGTVTSMLVGSGELNTALPLIGLAESDDGKVKVSARTTRTLVDQGLSLSRAMKDAAARTDGIGGGHNIAAGALIPKGRVEDFLRFTRESVKEQLEGR